VTVKARVVAALTIVAAAGFACGGATDIGEGVPRPEHPGDGGGVASFAADGASSAAQPQACTACRLDVQCGDRAACVAPATATGDGTCAPGCTKEGFCPSDSTCQWVTSMMTGASMRACIPRGGCTN
jgi:hypothetical protein